jgi:hypothetical protein
MYESDEIYLLSFADLRDPKVFEEPALRKSDAAVKVEGAVRPEKLRQLTDKPSTETKKPIRFK